MSSAYELEINRLNTKAYIDSDATNIHLERYTPNSDGAGGTITPKQPTYEADIVVRVVTSTSLAANAPRTVDGESVIPDLLVIAEFDADIRPGDILKSIDLWDYKVAFIQPDMRYEVLAEVVRLP